MFITKDLILNRIINKNLNDDLEVCSCNGMSIGDLKKEISNIHEFKDFSHFVASSGCGDVCELCQEKDGKIRVDITLYELYHEDV